MLHFDFETRSIADLREVGLWNYARHPSTDIWCAAHAFDDAEPEILLPDALPTRIVDYICAGGKLYAHNAAFELAIWNQIMHPRYGWPELKPAQTYCTMAQCYAMGLPGSLEDAAASLGLHLTKDIAGYNLMLRMARPRRMEGKTPVWWTDPDKLQRLFAYCQQDVRVEREISKRVAPLSEQEREIWLMDYEINQRGITVDLETAKAGAFMAEQIVAQSGQDLAVLTDGEVTSPNALIALKQWMEKQGVKNESLDKSTIIDLLAQPLPDSVRRALIIRQEAGKASVAKLNKIMCLAGSDGRLHNWGQYHGAATGRWAARGVQVHNLVRDMPSPATVDEILALVRNQEMDWIDKAFGPPMTMISQCLRSFFRASPGKKLIGGDFSAVEGVGTAWISGEEGKLQAFRAAQAGTGPGIYELAAHRTLGLPLDKITKSSIERQIGKVQELAFGYQGGVGAARKFLPTSMANTPSSVLDEWKVAWRAAHPNIVRTWYALEEAAILAVQNSGVAYAAGCPGRSVRFKKAGSFLWCKLPSGRVLCYPYPKILADTFGDKLTYMAMPSTNDVAKRNIINDPLNSSSWARISTYGGSLMENVVQAICRDILAACMLTLRQYGAQIVLHVHDEIVIEVDAAKAEAACAFMQKTLCTPPIWAKDFPLKAVCGIMDRYGKA